MNRLRRNDGLGVECRVALADLSKRPVHGLPDEIPLVNGLPPDDGQELLELPILGPLVVNGEARHQGESRSLHELFLSPAPFQRLLVGKGGPVEEIHAALVTDVPRIEVFHPGLHLIFGDLIWVFH